MLKILCFLLVNNRPIQSADSIGFWPIVSVSADSQNSTIGRPLSPANISLKLSFTSHGKRCIIAIEIKEVHRVYET